MGTGLPVSVLVVEDDPEHALIIRQSLARAGDGACEVSQVTRFDEALSDLAERRFDVILLDLSLPDSKGLDGIRSLRARFPEIPVVVLTASDSEVLGVESVRAGAQDYLVKGHVTGPVLVRAIRYAMARNQTQDILRALALRDELTGLYNRRGFVTLAEQHLKLARRTGRDAMLVYADLDGFKHVNDRFGHPEGDRALVAVAEILCRTFRESDIVARVGGDEFAVLALEASGSSAERIRHRLAHNVEIRNRSAAREYDLSVTAGIAAFDPQHAAGIEELIAEADRALYALKRARRQT